MSCNRRTPVVQSAPILDCFPFAYNAVRYVITGAFRAYWFRSGSPTVLNEIELVDGAAEGMIVTDSYEAYRICAVGCGGCGKVCCDFECTEPPVSVDACQYVIEETGEIGEVDYYELTITRSVSLPSFDGQTFFPDCDIDCMLLNLVGTYIFPCGIDTEYEIREYLCDAEPGSTGLQSWYVYALVYYVGADNRVIIQTGVESDELDAGRYFTSVRTYQIVRDDILTSNTCEPDSDPILLENSGLEAELELASDELVSGGCEAIAGYDYAIELVPVAAP